MTTYKEQGWYYLHTNGDLIYKRETGSTAADIRESPFAKAMWPLDTTDRASAWRIIIEGLAAGAKKERIIELASKWGCDEVDAENYAKCLDVILKKDGNAWCATRHDFTNLQASPAGFGDTPIEAFTELAKELGYAPSKIWGNSLAQLVR